MPGLDPGIYTVRSQRLASQWNGLPGPACAKPPCELTLLVTGVASAKAGKPGNDEKRRQSLLLRLTI